MISSWSHFHSRENCGVYWGGGCGLWLRCRVRVGCTTAACWDCWGWRREWWWHQSCSTETSEHTVCSSLHRYNIQHNIEWQTRCGSFHRYTDVSIQSPPAAPPSEPRDQHQHIQLDDRVQLQLESAPLCEQQHSVSVSHSVKGGNSRRTPCVLRFPGHTTNCTNTEQHVEGPAAAFTEKRQRDVLYGQVEGTKSSAGTLVFVHRQETQQETSSQKCSSWITHFLSVRMRLQPNTERCFCPDEPREETRVFTDIRSSERWNMRLESSSASRRAAVKPWVLMTDSDGTNTSWFKQKDKHGAPDPPAWEQADMSAVSESVSLSQWQ